MHDLNKTNGGDPLMPTTALERRLSTSLYTIGAAQGLYFGAYLIYKLVSSGAQMSPIDVAALCFMTVCSLAVCSIAAYRLLRYGLLGSVKSDPAPAMHYRPAMEAR